MMPDCPFPEGKLLQQQQRTACAGSPACAGCGELFENTRRNSLHQRLQRMNPYTPAAWTKSPTAPCVVFFVIV
jgi:murein tripeptide amidase MpaA